MHTPELAKTVASKMAALEINIVRLHLLTPEWQTWAPFYVDREKSTLEFNDAALERLDRSPPL